MLHVWAKTYQNIPLWRYSIHPKKTEPWPLSSQCSQGQVLPPNGRGSEATKLENTFWHHLMDMVSSMNRLNNSDQIEEHDKNTRASVVLLCWLFLLDFALDFEACRMQEVGNYVTDRYTNHVGRVCNVSQPSSQNGHIMQYSPWVSRPAGWIADCYL